MAVWYCRDDGTHGWSAVSVWSNHTAVAGELIRQATTPTNGNERVFVCIVAGATGSTEPTWVVTKGAKNVSSSATYQECTGQPAVNGDLTNTPLSSTVRGANPGLGKIIKDNGGTHIFICSTAGTCGAIEPTYSTAAVGNTTVDSGCTWTYIGTSFSQWAAPFARINSAHTTNWGAAGDTFYFRYDHAETQATTFNASVAGSAALPTFNYSVDDSLTLTAGASLTSTSSASILVLSAHTYFDGFYFTAGSGAVSAALNLGTSSTAATHKYTNCKFKKAGTVANSAGLSFGATGSKIIVENSTFEFGSASDSVTITAGMFVWRNTASAIAGATLPTTLFAPATGYGDRFIDGIDLSALGSGKTLVSAGSGGAAIFYFTNCEFGSSVTTSATPAAPAGPRVYVVASDSAATTYRQEIYDYTGTLTQETTIVRTGGATDGTTPIAWKIITTANSKWLLPFESVPIAIWNDTTGAPVTATIYGIWGSGSTPNNDDIWIDVEYLGNSGFPLASNITSSKANNLATGSSLSSDSSTWGGSTTPFKMSVTFTPQLKGYVRIIVRAAKVSSTFYVDPKPILS